MDRLLKDRRIIGLGIVGLLALTALSSYNAATTNRFAWDLSITEWIQKLEVSESFEDVLFYMGILGLGGAVMVPVWLWQWFRGHRMDALLLLLTLLPNGLIFLVRDLFDRPRPVEEGLVNVIGGPQGASYPSGHGFMVVLLYGFLLYLLTRYSSSKRAIYGVSALLLLYIPFAGLWLIHHGRHWPSDVFGGYLYGALVLVIWIRLHKIAGAWEERHPDFLTLATLQRAAGKLGLVRGA